MINFEGFRTYSVLTLKALRILRVKKPTQLDLTQNPPKLNCPKNPVFYFTLIFNHANAYYYLVEPNVLRSTS